MTAADVRLRATAETTVNVIPVEEAGWQVTSGNLGAMLIERRFDEHTTDRSRHAHGAWSAWQKTLDPCSTDRREGRRGSWASSKS